jgi:DNA-binding MarR family transcriptional regulator
MDSPPAAIDSLRRLVRALRVTSHTAWTEVGISGAQLFVLQQLADGRALSLGELATRTHTDPSSVSVVAARLVERGLVHRRAARDDARRAELTLAPAGQQLLDRAPTPVQARLVDAIAALPARSRTQLARTLAQLVDELALGDAPATMFFEEEPGSAATIKPARTRSRRRAS